MRLLALVLCCSTANADFNFDTGTPTDTVGSSLSSTSYLPTAQSKLGAVFTLTAESSTITGIEGFISSFNEGLETGGEVMASIYSHSISPPPARPEARLFTETFTMPNDDMGNWHGVSGINLVLPAGNYWVVFEVADDSTFSGGLKRGAEAFLPMEAFYSARSKWKRDDTVDHGWRVSGTPPDQFPVPEPTGLTLMSVAFVLLCQIRFSRPRSRRTNLS